MNDNEILFVPVSLNASVVGADRQAVNMAPNFRDFADDRVAKVGNSFRAEPWQDIEGPNPSNLQLERGVHLHWALPAALTHGIQMSGGEMVFPRVPNRWLVLRISGDPTPQTKAWILQSDYLGEPNAESNSSSRQKDSSYLLVSDKDAYVIRQIGRNFGYDESGWETILGSTEAWALSAVAPGNPGLAAFYPGCRNVFGFHDSLDQASGKFSYLVAGWYVPLVDDPLKSPRTCPANQPDWWDHFKRAWLDGRNDPLPSRTLCHGIIRSVAWPPASPGLNDPGTQIQYQLAVGNTAIEGLSALASQVLNQQRREPLLSAFQYDIVGKLDKLAGVPEFQEELHRRRFSPTEGGGIQWVLRPVQRPAASTPEKERQSQSFPDDPQVSLWFNQLCRLQEKCDRFGRERVALGHRYYALWFKRTIAECSGDEVAKELKGGSETDCRLQEAIGKKERTITKLGTYIEARRSLIQKRILSLAQARNPATPLPDYELIPVPRPRFWRPNDPAIVLGNSGTAKRHRYVERSAKATCRVYANIISSLTAKGVSLTAKKLEEMHKFHLEERAGSEMPLNAVKALYYESLLLDRDRTSDFADWACKEASYRGSSADVANQWKQQIEITLSGRQDVVEGTTTFDPLFMVWKMEWRPAHSDPGQWNQTNNWCLDANGEFQGNSSCKPSSLDNGTAYFGWAPLSIDIGEHLNQHAKDNVFSKWDFLSQCANGFSNRLILREESLQLPPLTKDGIVDDQVALLTEAPKDAGKAGDLLKHLFASLSPWSPPLDSDAPPLSPVRAGHIRVAGLWLVDVFGRSKPTIGREEIFVAESFGGGRIDPKSWIRLPPRIVQPSRLRCSWVSVADERHGRYRESNSNPATSPILGWVIPNYFDRSLVLCDANGKVRGELSVSAGNPELQLLEVPGCVRSANGQPSLDSDECFQLSEFVKGFCAAGPGALKALLTIASGISLCITTPAARRLQTMDLVLGQPLVLARASLTLELWAQLAGNPPWAETAAPGTNGTPSIKFPVRLGDLRRSNDGLLGYFLPDAANHTDYTKMRLTYGATKFQDCPPYFVFDDSAYLGLCEASTKLTLLMDPRAGVHFVSGILPTQVLELPDNAARQTSEGVELSFRTGPVLSKKQSLRLPLPENAGGTWSWFDRDQENANWEQNADVSKSTTAPAVSLDPVGIYDGWLSFKKDSKD